MLLKFQVGGIYVRLFLKDPKFPLRNPKRFLEGLLDQYVSSVAATHYEANAVDPELPRADAHERLGGGLGEKEAPRRAP